MSADASFIRRAKKAYKRAVKLAPAMAEAWFELGLVLVEMREQGAAAKALKRSAQLSPRYAEALRRMMAQQAMQTQPQGG